jgi:hypothetical protein
MHQSFGVEFYLENIPANRMNEREPKIVQQDREHQRHVAFGREPLYDAAPP